MKLRAMIFCMAMPITMLLSGCVNPPNTAFAPPNGVFLCAYEAPLLIDFDQTSIGPRSGNAESFAFHEVLLTDLSFAWGDCSAGTAARSGGLNRIGSADYEYLGIMRIFGKTTVHVHAPAGGTLRIE